MRSASHPQPDKERLTTAQPRSGLRPERGFAPLPGLARPSPCTTHVSIFGSAATGELLSRINAAGFNLTTGEPGTSISEQLLEGRLDVLLATSPIDDPRAIRMFPNYQEVEQDYLTRTRILPISQLVVVRRELCELEPSIPILLTSAWKRSKEISKEYETHPNHSNLVWSSAYEDREQALFGDPYSFSIQDHRPTLDAFVTYAYEQGFTSQLRDPDDLFI